MSVLGRCRTICANLRTGSFADSLGLIFLVKEIGFPFLQAGYLWIAQQYRSVIVHLAVFASHVEERVADIDARKIVIHRNLRSVRVSRVVVMR